MKRLMPLALLLAQLGAGCGFQLRGAVDLPPGLSPVAVQAGPESTISGALTRALRDRGAQVVGSPADGRVAIRVLEETQDSRVAAVNNQGKVIGIELLYRVAFDAVRPGGEPLVPVQRIELAREYINPEVEVLGKAEEAEIIRRDMVQDMADRIVRRLVAQLP
jgi:LPS-assembly lipoprotein